MHYQKPVTRQYEGLTMVIYTSKNEYYSSHSNTDLLIDRFLLYRANLVKTLPNDNTVLNTTNDDTEEINFTKTIHDNHIK